MAATKQTTASPAGPVLPFPLRVREIKEKIDTPAILARLGVLGLDEIEPAILAALIQEEPLLLGRHGTGKSYLLNRHAGALRIKHRHYNASLLNFDDLVGSNRSAGLDNSIRVAAPPAPRA